MHTNEARPILTGSVTCLTYGCSVLPPCTWSHSNLVPFFFFLPSSWDWPELKQSSSKQNSPEQITETPLFNRNSFPSPQRPCVCQTPSVKITCRVFDVCKCVCVGVWEAQHGWLSEVSVEVIKKRQGDSTIFVSSIRASVQGKAEYPPVSLIRYTVCLSHTTPFPRGASTWWTQQSVFGSDLCVKSVRDRVWQIN